MCQYLSKKKTELSVNWKCSYHAFLISKYYCWKRKLFSFRMKWKQSHTLLSVSNVRDLRKRFFLLRVPSEIFDFLQCPVYGCTENYWSVSPDAVRIYVCMTLYFTNVCSTATLCDTRQSSRLLEVRIRRLRYGGHLYCFELHILTLFVACNLSSFL